MTRHGNDAAPPVRSELWSLREDVYAELEPGDGPIRLHSRWGVVTVQRPSPTVREVLHRMRLGPIWLENAIADAPGPAAASARPVDTGGTGNAAAADSAVCTVRTRGGTQRMQLHRVLERLQPLVVRSLALGTGQPLLSVVPLTPRSRFRPLPLPPDVPVRLSTFAELRTDGHEFRLESPLSLHRVLLHRTEAILLLGSLDHAVTPTACVSALPGLTPVTADALAYLAGAGMVVKAETAPAGKLPVFAEDSDPELAGWSPIDLMFHTRSTLGRHDGDFGATYPMGESQCPEPVVKPQSAGPAIPLHRPRWEDLDATDPSLTCAIEARRSTRTYGTQPLTAAEIGELLYRTARIRSLLAPSSAAQQTRGERDRGWPTGSAATVAKKAFELSDRPYPSGGARHELELYITVGECTGISPGVYHYDPLGHRLEPVNANRAAVDRLLSNARAGAHMDRLPPVLISMTARFRRLSWKYEGLAYCLALKHVGVLSQTLYLVSTAMGLAACALGGVSIETTARAFGTDWRTEPTVGEFIIGRDPGTYPDRPGGYQPANDASWADQARAQLRGGGTAARRTAARLRKGQSL